MTVHAQFLGALPVDGAAHPFVGGDGHPVATTGFHVGGHQHAGLVRGDGLLQEHGGIDVFRVGHVRLAPGMGALGEGRGPDLLDGVHDGLEADHVGDRAVQARPGEAGQVLDIGVAAHEHARGVPVVELFLQRTAQPFSECLAGVGARDPFAQTGKHLPRLVPAPLGVVDVGQPVIFVAHPVEGRRPAGLDRAIEQLAERAEGHDQPGTDLPGEVVCQFAEIGGLGPDATPGVAASQVGQGDHVGSLEVELVEIRADGHVLAAGFGTEDLVPFGTVGGELNATAGGCREHDAPAEMTLQSRHQAIVDYHVGNAEVAGQQLHVRERAALATGEDARDRWQLGRGRGHEVDAVRAEIARVVGRFEQHPTAQSRVERAQAGGGFLAEHLVAHVRPGMGVLEQPVEHARVGEQRAVPQPVGDVVGSQGRDGGPVLDGGIEVVSQRALGPLRDTREVAQLRLPCVDIGFVLVGQVGDEAGDVLLLAGREQAAAVERRGEIGQPGELPTAVGFPGLLGQPAAHGIGLLFQCQACLQQAQPVGGVEPVVVEKPVAPGNRVFRGQAQACVECPGPVEPLGRLAQDRPNRTVAAFPGQRLQSPDRGLRFVEDIQFSGEPPVIVGQVRLALLPGVPANALGVAGVGHAVDLHAQVLEVGIFLGDPGGQFPHPGGGRVVAVHRQQAGGLAQQQVAFAAAPAGIVGHGEQHLAGLTLFVLDLDRPPVVARLAEDPAVVETDQKTLEQDLAEFVQPGLGTRVIVGV